MKNDFCVEVRMETTFPHLNKFMRGFYPITTEAIDDWFKQCLDDTPSAYLSVPWKEWFKKWFSQFIEE